MTPFSLCAARPQNLQEEMAEMMEDANEMQEIMGESYGLPSPAR